MVDGAEALEAKFLEIIDQLLRGESDVPTFTQSFRRFYFDELPEGVLSSNQGDFLYEVSEKVRWVSSDPFPIDEDISDGVLPHREFLAWLKAKRAAYPGGAPE